MPDGSMAKSLPLVAEQQCEARPSGMTTARGRACGNHGWRDACGNGKVADFQDNNEMTFSTTTLS